MKCQNHTDLQLCINRVLVVHAHFKLLIFELLELNARDFKLPRVLLPNRIKRVPKSFRVCCKLSLVPDLQDIIQSC